MKKLTKAATAKKLGVARGTVYALIERGVLTPDENGLIDPEQVDPHLCTPCAENVQDETAVGQSKPRLSVRYIASLERQVAFLQAEVERLQRLLEEVIKKSTR